MHTLRFWTFHRLGWVKLTLRPGQSLTARTFSRDDEGCSWSCETWTHSGDRVTSRWGNGGRDCDGEISHTGEGECLAARLAAVPAYLDDPARMEPATVRSFYWRNHVEAAHFAGRRIHRPDWQESQACETRDAYAEAAGY